MNEFSELSLSPVIQNNLNRLCFKTPTSVQAASIPPALAGSDVVATAQTGTGKTLAFLLPILEKLLANSPGAGNDRVVKALVLSPTRELALQIHEAFTGVAAGTRLRAAVVVGGLSEGKQLQELKRGVDIVIATPGRLEDFMNRRLIRLSGVETLVLDEADRMLDMGFLPAIEKILSALPPSRQSLFFSATMEDAIERLIRRHSQHPIRVAVNATTKPPEQIDLHLYEIEHDRKTGLLRHMLEREEGSFLVFVRTKHGTDRLAKRLSRSGLRAVAMHGDRTQNQRNQALAGFRDGRYRVLVATDVAARGIHVDSVAHVVNFDLPQAPSDFIHRIGRTGRAGQRGTASTFYVKSERGEIRRIERECKVRLIPQQIAGEIQSDAEMKGLEPAMADEPRNQRTPPAPHPRASAETHAAHPDRSRRQFRGYSSGRARPSKKTSR